MSDVCTPVANPSAFIFAGKAEFTLQSKATGHHFSYRVTASQDSRMFFVAVVQGGSKLYAGVVPADARSEFRSTRASKLDRTSPPVAALEWFLKHPGHPQVEVHHCGKCGRCGRKLTTPESIQRGIGPECLSKLEAA